MTVFQMPRGVFSMTPDQRDCLQVIAEWVEERGRPPSIRALAGELDINQSSAHRLVCCLEDRGWLTRQPDPAEPLRLLHRPPMPDFTPIEWSLAPALAAAGKEERNA